MTTPTSDDFEDLEYSARGFASYGSFVDTYRTTVSVYESSAASGPHVWVKAERDRTPGSDDQQEAAMHLNMEQAAALVSLLTRAISHAAVRWDADDDDEEQGETP